MPRRITFIPLAHVACITITSSPPPRSHGHRHRRNGVTVRYTHVHHITGIRIVTRQHIPAYRTCGAVIIAASHCHCRRRMVGQGITYAAVHVTINYRATATPAHTVVGLLVTIVSAYQSLFNAMSLDYWYRHYYVTFVTVAMNRVTSVITAH